MGAAAPTIGVFALQGDVRGHLTMLTALGVRAAEVLKDYDTPMDRIYDPVNPDANSDGFVEMPNVSATREMADLVTAMRAYEANLKVQENFSQMAERALRLAR